MFLVFNREKICTYIVSLLTVMMLLFTVANLNQNNKTMVETSTNLEKSSNVENKIITEQN